MDGGKAVRRIAALVATICWSLGAQAQTKYGQWEVGVSEDKSYIYAGTENESTSALMKACTIADGLCRWYLMTPIKCKVGDTYAFLINSSDGVSPIQAQCASPIQHNRRAVYRYVLLDPDSMDNHMTATGYIGLAYGLADGNFNVNRFSLNGSTKSILLLHEAAVRLTKGGARDSTL